MLSSFSKVLIIFLLTFSTFGLFVSFTQAQSGQRAGVCFDSNTGQMWKLGNNTSCANNASLSYQNLAAAFCIKRDSASGYVFTLADSTTGKCADAGIQPIKYQDLPDSPTSPPIIPPGTTPDTPTTPTTGTTTPGTTTPGTTKTTQQPSTTPAGNQTCDAGFTKLGPLCVPNNPFTGSDSIAGSQSIGELAARIIRVMLFVAGIVAVIFVIIGGYQIMTAQGNETAALNGRKTLTNALIGLVLIIMAYAIVQAVISFVLR